MGGPPLFFIAPMELGGSPMETGGIPIEVGGRPIEFKLRTLLGYIYIYIYIYIIGYIYIQYKYIHKYLGCRVSNRLIIMVTVRERDR